MNEKYSFIQKSIKQIDNSKKLITQYLSNINKEKQVLFKEINNQNDCYKGKMFLQDVKKQWNVIYTSYRKISYNPLYKLEQQLYNHYHSPEFYDGTHTQQDIKNMKGINKILYYTIPDNFEIHHSSQCVGMYTHNLTNNDLNDYCIIFNPNILCIMNNGQTLQSGGHGDFILVATYDINTKSIKIKKSFIE